VEQPRVECLISAGFSWTGQVYQALQACDARKLAEEFGNEGVEIRAEVAEASLESLEALLRDMTRGEASVSRSG
jgi:putative IMPACT (imprinted ancient) family translation regulator